MKYMLLAYSPESAWTEEEWIGCTRESMDLCHELESQNQFIAAEPLTSVTTAKSVRVRHGRPVITAGPFAETVEQLGGFFLIDVPDLDAAIEVAGRLPSARKGTVEIRPVDGLEGLPADQFETTSMDSSRYLLLCYDDPQIWDSLEATAKTSALTESVQLANQLKSREQYLSAAPLYPVAMATSVRIRQGKRLVTDGPFAETRECLGGYYAISARDQNDAIAIAAQHPGAKHGTVEVRKIYDL
jgi:hypothetical protein